VFVYELAHGAQVKEKDKRLGRRETRSIVGKKDKENKKGSNIAHSSRPE
jgi:hypothetical protein